MNCAPSAAKQPCTGKAISACCRCIGALTCCNDEAGRADRRSRLGDWTTRPFGLTERERVPDATLRIFHEPYPARTGMFDED